MLDGEDQLLGGDGEDTMVGGSDRDTLIGQAGSDTLDGDSTAIPGSAHGDDYLEGNSKTDWMYGSGGADNLAGGSGGDRLFGDAATVESRYHGPDDLFGEGGSDHLVGGGRADTLVGGERGDTLYGDGNEADTYHGQDNLRGGPGTDTLFGLGKGDNLQGGSGNDELYGQEGDDLLFSGDGDDTLGGGLGADTYVYNLGDGTDTVYDATPDNTLRFGEGISPEDLTLGIGSLKIDIAGTGSLHFKNFNPDTPFASTPIDRVEFSDGKVLEKDQFLALGLEISGTDQGETLEGTLLDDRISGNGGRDSIFGRPGSDRLKGGAGPDIISGNEGNDELFGGKGADYLSAREGDNRLYGGSGDDALEGGDGADRLFGERGDDRFFGGYGPDTLVGGQGDDRYSLYLADVFRKQRISTDGDRIMEEPGEGTDRVRLEIDDQVLEEYPDLDFTLPEHVENLKMGLRSIRVSGNSLDNRMEGNFSRNVFLGEAGDDTLEGRGRRDTLAGGPGDDTYVIDTNDPRDGDDTLIENESEGVDRVLFRLEDASSPTFKVPNYVENLTILKDVSEHHALGNNLGNEIRGNEFANQIRGKGGSDDINGGGFSDNLYGGSGSDRLLGGDNAWKVPRVEAPVFLLSAPAPGGSFVDGGTFEVVPNQDNLFGGKGADNLDGESGDDLLKGGPGDDVLYGGDDGKGPPPIQPSRDVESEDGVVLSGDSEDKWWPGGPGFYRTNDDTLFGGNGADTLKGGTGSDELFGGTGADLMSGGPGNDEIHVERDGDQALELAGEGYDIVFSAISYALPQHVEELRLTGSSGIDATGNAADNRLVGNAGGNTLDGKAGADTLVGGAGSDTYRLDSRQDQVVEEPEGGTDDTVRTDAAYSLEPNVENVELIGSAPVDLTGNGGNNRLQGNGAENELAGLGGDDVLAGGGGADTLLGGAGADRASYAGSDAGVRIDLAAGTASGGTADGDRFQGLWGVIGSDFGDTLLGSSGRNRLAAGGGDDILRGRGGADYLAAGSGRDALQGGAGPDTYAYGPGDGRTLIEDPGSENSVVFGGSIAASGLTLGLGSLKIRVPGAGNLRIAGFDPDAPYESVTISEFRFPDGTVLSYEELLDRGFDIRGTSGADELSGTAIEDRIRGFEGNDRIRAKEGDDLLAGGAGRDRLFGAKGEDTLRGGAGTDFLAGERGADTLSGGAGRDYLSGGRSTDTADYSGRAAGVTVDLSRGHHLLFSYFGGDPNEDVLRSIENLTGSAHADELTGDREANRLAGGAGDDRLTGGAGEDRLLGGTGLDTAVYRNSRGGVTADLGEGTASRERRFGWGRRPEVETDTLTGIEAVIGGRGADELSGDTGGNRLIGGRGHDELAGQAGTDWLTGGRGRDEAKGGAGSDALEGGQRRDALIGGAGSDFLAGGAGQDRLDATAGSDVVAFNAGDGRDRVETGKETDKLTLSLGDGLGLEDLNLKRRGEDLLLEADKDHHWFGGGFGRDFGRNARSNNALVLDDWYADGGSQRPEETRLQMVVEGQEAYDPEASEAHLRKRLQSYDFDKIAAAFDRQSGRDNRWGPWGRGSTKWDVMDAALESHLEGSDSEAIGGELARRYGVKGSLEILSRPSVVATLADERFGEVPQTLQSLNGGSGSV